MPRPKRPHVAKRTIRGQVRYVADLGKVEGKRLQKICRTRREAEEYLEEQKSTLAKHGHSALAISHAERVLFERERDRLAKAGATISQAVDFFLAHHKPLKKPVTLQRLFEMCSLEKELGGARKRYLQTFRCSCRSFIRGRENRQAHTVTRDEVKSWILGNGWEPKTQRVYLGDVRSMLSWGVSERYLPANPVAGDEGYIELEQMHEAEISAFGLEPCVALLRAALLGRGNEYDRRSRKYKETFCHRSLLGYLALALFCGVRPEEVKRTTIAEMDLRERAVIIMGRSAKTRQRRVIELPRVAVIWLRLWRRLCPSEEQFLITNFDRRWKKLRSAAGLSDWPHDILRHTCATYTFAEGQNIAKLQALLGHSEDEDTLFRHYRAVRTLSGRMITKRMGEEFFSLTPRRVRLWDRKKVSSS